MGNRGEIIDRLIAGEDDFCVFSHLPEKVDLHASEFLANPWWPSHPRITSLPGKKLLTGRPDERNVYRAGKAVPERAMP